MEFRVQGETGITQSCLIALESALAGPAPVQKVTVLTKNGREHLFVVWESLEWPYIGAIIPSGFMSGYRSEGGRGFSLALCMIHELKIPIEHLTVNEIAFDKIDSGEFPSKWHNQANESASPLEMPVAGWVFNNHWQLMSDHRLWRVQRWKLWNSPMDWPNPAYFVDKFSWDVGDKLYAASVNLSGNAQPEKCQQVGLMLRDAWIEFTSIARSDLDEIDKEVGINDVKRVIDTMQLPVDTAVKGRKSHSLTNTLQHDRRATPQTAEHCFNECVEAMAEIIEMRFEGVTDPRSRELLPTN